MRARRLPALHLWRLPPWDRLVGSEPGTFIPVIRAAFAALHPDRTGLLSKAALHSKGGREPRATRTCCVRNHSGAGATPAPSLRRLMMTPSLSRHAVSTAFWERLKNNLNYSVRSLGKAAETSMDSRLQQHTRCHPQHEQLRFLCKLHNTTEGWVLRSDSRSPVLSG